MYPSRRVGVVLACIALACGVVGAQEAPGQEKEGKSWSNETELSLVVTEGNSNTTTLGFKNLLQRKWTDAQFQLKLEALRSATSDDWFEQVDPGITWLPGEEPPAATSTLVKPASKPDAENYFFEGRYDRQIRKGLNWHAGASWDRNKDAGILNRYIAFGGVGNLWWDREDLRFQTSYGLSWTDREEETVDPLKDETFTGARLSWTYLNMWGKTTTYTNDWTINVSLKNTQDWSSEMTNAISVSINKWLSLRVSLRWLYNNVPALQDVDLLALVEIRDPDGVPGSGDEFFETVSEGGSEIVFGETDVRKQKLDQVVKSTLVVSF